MSYRTSSQPVFTCPCFFKNKKINAFENYPYAEKPMKVEKPIPNCTDAFLEELLTQRVERTPRGCILSQRAVNGNGTPVAKLDKASMRLNPSLADKDTKQVSIRRLVMKNSRHPNARDVQQHERVINTCGNDRCINIAHLKIVTTSDIGRKGRKLGAPTRRTYPKIEGDVRMINLVAMELAMGMTINEVHERNNISIHDIMDVRNGKYDQHIVMDAEKTGFDWQEAKERFQRKARQWISPAKRREIALDDTMRYSDLAKKYAVSLGTVSRIKADYQNGKIKA